MATQINPGLADELQAYGAERRRQVLQLRQLLRGVRALRGAARPAAPLRCTRCSWGSRTSSRAARALALLLLRRVLGAVPQGGRARRDHDEHAPLAHVQVRLQRPQRAVLPLAGAGRSSPSCIAAILTGIGFVLFGILQRRQLQRLRRRERLPAERTTSTASTGRWRSCSSSCSASTSLRMWRFVMGGSGAGHRLVPRRPAAAAVPLLHAGQVPAVRAQAPVGGPPGAHAELRHHARADHVLPARDAAGPRSTGACTRSATWPRSG